MKKVLLAAAFLSVCGPLSAQLLDSDNFNSYAVGNVSTSTNGTTPGVGNYRPSGGLVTDYQIVNGDAVHSNYLQVTTGGDATTASNRAVLKDGFATAWANRTPGNNIVKGSVDIFTGTSTNKHNSGVLIAGTNGTATVGIVGIRYNSDTKTITGMAYLVPTGGTGAFYNITGLTTNTYPANTWIPLGYSYNKTTGEITYTIDGVNQVLTVTGAASIAGLDPATFQVSSSAITTAPANTGVTTFGIDNYRVEASNNTVLGTGEVKVSENSLIAIGPNPAHDYLHILTNQKINNIAVADMTGKSINVKLVGDKIDISALPVGTYLIKIETKNGITTEKFIKK